MSFLKKGWITLSILLLLNSWLAAQNVVQNFGTAGTINWSQKVLYTTGIGALNSNVPEVAQRAEAIETAKRAAFRNVMVLIKKMILTSESTGEDLLVGDEQLNRKIETVVRSFTVTDVRHMSTGDVEVDVELPIAGALAELLLPKKFGGGQLLQITQPLCPLCGQPWPEGKPIPDDVKLIMPGGAQSHDGLNHYTGLVVDARGLNVQPALAARILDEANNEIYSSSFSNRVIAEEFGLVGYAKNMELAKRDERVRNHSMVIKAIGSSGTKRVDVIITQSDSRLLHGAAANVNFLERCRVIFLID